MPTPNPNLLALLMANEQQLPSPLLIDQPQELNQPLPQPEPQAQGPQPKKILLNEYTQKGNGIGSYGQQLDDAFFKSLEERGNQTQQLQQQLAKLQQEPKTFADVNLRPALAFADSLMGTNTAYAYQPPTGEEKRKEQMQKLQDAISKNQSGISDDQLGYLKMKASEESLKLREKSMANALSGRGEREESAIRKEYLNHPVIKGMKEVDQAASAIEGNPGIGGPAQQAMVFQFSKILDPESVVREGEYAQSAANAGVINQARNYLNRLKTGETLTTQQITEMKEVVRNLTDSYRNRVNDVNSYYNDLSLRKGFDPRNVIVDPYMGGKADLKKKANVAANTTAPTKKLEDMSDDELKKYLGE